MLDPKHLASVLFAAVVTLGRGALANPPACSDPAKCLAECTDGVARSCTVLGSMYENGISVAESRERAVKFYKSGCELGDPSACKKAKGVESDAAGDRAAQQQASAQQAQAASRQADDDLQAARKRHDDCRDVSCVAENGRCTDAVPDIDTCWSPDHPATSPEANACEARLKSDNRNCTSAFNRCLAACEPEWQEAQRKHNAK